MEVVIGLIILLLAVLSFPLAFFLFRTKSKLKNLSLQNKDLINKNTEITEENKSLSKFKPILDAEKASIEIIQRAKVKHKEIVDSANNEYQKIITSATNKSHELIQNANKILNNADNESKIIVESANKKAQEIAGKAYDAIEKASFYEQTARAMKNIIEGYGNQYLIPAQSLIDELAEAFGFTEAGQEYKIIREKIKDMCKTKTGATCNYVESNRRDTAIEFVLDAFNGKVDSILSRVKSDNYGKLKQEIIDSFNIVNFNGKAFRDAKITEDYLEARLTELKWASIIQQLKLDEKEEQRRIKEQMREEEKARKEYERAIKEAQKEEEMLQIAMEKVKTLMEKSNVEQKLKYEKQLEELNIKLKEAEENNKRAQSMAQQTKRGYVYIISNIGSFGEDIYKIGQTRRLDPLDRVRELGDSSVPFEFDVHAMIDSDNAPELENVLHKKFVINRVNKVNYRKEFFKVSLHEIRAMIEQMNLNVKWTMTAQATQYRETLIINKTINENSKAREDWINRQLKLEDYELKHTGTEDID